MYTLRSVNTVDKNTNPLYILKERYIDRKPLQQHYDSVSGRYRGYEILKITLRPLRALQRI